MRSPTPETRASSRAGSIGSTGSPATAGHDVVGGEDDRPLTRDTAQPAQVDLRTRKPLHVDDRRIELANPATQPLRAGPVLERLQRQPQRGARPGSEEPARQPQED